MPQNQVKSGDARGLTDRSGTRGTGLRLDRP